MKKTLQSLLGALLVAAMVLSTAACAKSPASSGGGASSPSSTASETKTNNYPDYLNLDSMYPAVKEGSGEKVTLTLLTGRNNTTGEVPIDKVYFFRYLADIMNVQFELEESADMDTRRSLMFSTGDIPDIVWGGVNPTNAELVTNGMEEHKLLNWNDYLNETLMPNATAMKEKYVDSFVRDTLPDGSIYALPRITNGEYNSSIDGYLTSGVRTFINQKWLDAAGLELPKTLDDFMNMVIAFKEQDPMKLGEQNNGWICNAKLDQCYIWTALGFYGQGQPRQMSFAIKDKKVQLLCYTPEFKEYLSVYHKLYEAGAISKDYFTMDTTTARALMSSQNCGVMSDWVLSSTQATTYGDWVCAPVITSDYCDNAIASDGSKTTVNCTAAAADTKYPEVIARIMDYMYSDEASLMYYYGPMKGTDLAEKYGVEGWYFDEKGTITADSVVSGKYGSMDFYIGDQIYGSMYPAGNAMYSKELAKEEAKKNGYQDTGEYETKVFEDALTGEKITYDNVLKQDPKTDANTWWRATTCDAWQGHVTAISLPGAYLTAEETQATADIVTVLTDYVSAQAAKFITGERSLDEFDTFQKELEDLGVKEYVETYTKAYSTYMDSVAQYLR